MAGCPRRPQQSVLAGALDGHRPELDEPITDWVRQESLRSDEGRSP